MSGIKQRIKDACSRKNISVSSMLMAANIQSGDYYQAINGKKPLFPSWKKRISETLGISEGDLFEMTDNKTEAMQNEEVGETCQE